MHAYLLSSRSRLHCCTYPLAELEGGYGGCNSRIKESNKTKQILTEDNPLEKEEERKSCMFV